MAKSELCPLLRDYLVLRIMHTNVVYISNRYSGVHTWLPTHYCTVCNNNRKSYDLKMMVNVIVGMVTSFSHYFQLTFQYIFVKAKLHHILLGANL